MKFLLAAFFAFAFARRAPSRSNSSIEEEKNPAKEQPNTNCPNGIITRKEFRDMTLQEWTTFKEAMLAIYSKKSNKKHNETIIDYWTGMHLDHVPDAHNTAQFFPWHRVFVKKFEDEMRTLYPTLTIPYWDWSVDAKYPLKSPIFSPKHLGFVKLGPEGDCRWRVSYPKKHCLVRNYSPKHFSSFYDTKTMAKLVSRKGKFEEFSDLMEGAPHGAAHIMIGGKKGDFSGMMSPNDPFFWLHHAYIDKLWDDWQHYDSSGKRLTEYNGKHRGRSVDASDYLKPFGVQVRDVFDVEKDLCYRYQPYSGKRAIHGLDANEEKVAEGKEMDKVKQEKEVKKNKEEKEVKQEKREKNGEKEKSIEREKSNRLNNKKLNKETLNNKQLKETLNNTQLNSTPNENNSSTPKDNAQFSNPITRKIIHSDPNLSNSSANSKDQQIQTDAEISTIPREIPQHWIEHHGFDLKAFRRNEQILQQLYRQANGLEANGCTKKRSFPLNLSLCICAFVFWMLFANGNLPSAKEFSR